VAKTRNGLTNGLEETCLKSSFDHRNSVNIRIPNVTVVSPDVIHKVEEFHRTLATLQNVLCDVCLEQFPTFVSNTTPTEVCRRYNLDTQIPKLFSLQSNLDPSPVPLELSVSSKNLH